MSNRKPGTSSIIARQVSVECTTAPAHGSLTVAADGTWTYTPDSGFTGIDSASYTITDAFGHTANSTITITVVPPAAPAATDDAYTAQHDKDRAAGNLGELGGATNHNTRPDRPRRDPDVLGDVVCSLP